MCDTCRTDPEIIPPMPDPDMIPAVHVADPVNAAIVTMALDMFAESYIKNAESIGADPRTNAYAGLVTMCNMTNVAERVCAMMTAIADSVDPPHNPQSQSNVWQSPLL